MGRARFIIYLWFIYFFYFFVVMSRGLDLHSAAQKISVNHATRGVYSPEAFEACIHRQCYGYYFLYCVLNIFFFGGRFEGNNKYTKKGITSAMEYVDLALSLSLRDR